MSQLAAVYSRFKRDTLPFSIFLFAILLFTVAAISLYLHRAVDASLFDLLLPQGRLEFVVMVISASVILGYVISLSLQLYQQLRQRNRFAAQFVNFEKRLQRTLMGMLLTSEQMEQLQEKPNFDLMIANIETAPYQDDRIREVASDNQESLQLRLNMVHQFQLHYMVMSGLAAQLHQLEQCCGSADQAFSARAKELKKLLAAFDGQLYLNTHQEKWAKLFNAYQPLCQFLGRSS